MMTTALVWCLLIGLWQATIKELKLKQHGRKPKSLFRRGLDFLREALLFSQANKLDLDTAFKLLSCTQARYYKRFGWYAKRLKQEGFELIALLSTLPTGVQEVIAAWKARWGLERVHRLLKRNVGLCKCRHRSYAAQLKHADLTHTALLCIREQKQLSICFAVVRLSLIPQAAASDRPFCLTLLAGHPFSQSFSLRFNLLVWAFKSER